MAFQIINQKYCSRKKSQAMSKNGRLDTSKEVIVMVQAKDGGWSVQGYGTEIICCPPNIWLCLCISQSILLFNEFMWLVIASGIWADGCMSLLDRGNRWAASVSLCPCYGDLGAPTFRWQSSKMEEGCLICIESEWEMKLCFVKTPKFGDIFSTKA